MKPKNKNKNKNKNKKHKMTEEYKMILLKISLGFLLCFTIYSLIIISTNVGIITHNIDLTYNANRWCATNNEIYLENNLSIRCHPDNLMDTYEINKTKPLKDFYISGISAMSENHITTVSLSLIIGILITTLIILPSKWKQ